MNRKPLRGKCRLPLFNKLAFSALSIDQECIPFAFKYPDTCNHVAKLCYLYVPNKNNMNEYWNQLE